MSDSPKRMLDDLAKLAGSVASAGEGLREEAETALEHQLARIIERMHLVRREELEALMERLEALEKKDKK